jgi:hypothetical protein
VVGATRNAGPVAATRVRWQPRHGGRAGGRDGGRGVTGGPVGETATEARGSAVAEV